jgi:hypothetical protein
LSAVTRISLKKVKKDREALKRGRWGSSALYEVEYRWTSEETPVTTISLTAVRGSKRNPQEMVTPSLVLQGVRRSRVGEWARATSEKAKQASRKVRAIPVVATRAAPAPPSHRPPKPARTVPTRGKTSRRRYIKQIQTRYFNGYAHANTRGIRPL